MREYLKSYIDSIDEALKGEVTEEMVEEHLIKISFFQHERLIHLMVSLFYGLFLFISALVVMQIPLFYIIVLILVVILVFYIRHYFFLENGVQYLYKQYDMMKEKLALK